MCATANSASQAHCTVESSTPRAIARPAPTLTHTSPPWSSHTHPVTHHPTGAQLTALRFDPGGLQLAAGTSSGLVGLWDLRARRPLLVKDHMYGDAIRDIKFHSGGVSGGAELGREGAGVSAGGGACAVTALCVCL